MTHHIVAHEKKSTAYATILKDFKRIPKGIKIIALSLFVAYFWWWLWGDVYFSLYLKKIVDNVFWVSVFWAFLSLVKLIFSLPVWDLEEKEKTWTLLFFWKSLYILVGLCYFLAGIMNSVSILVIALTINGIAMSISYITNQTYLRKHSTPKSRYLAVWLVFTAMNAGFVIGSLISATFINRIELPYVFLFVMLFSFGSLLVDFYLTKKEKVLWLVQKYISRRTIKRVFKTLVKEAFSFAPYRKIFSTLKEYNYRMYGALWLHLLVNMLAYVWFLFVPIIAVKNNFTLPEIAILFAVMRSPYILDFFTTELVDRYSKRKLIGVILLFLSLLFALFGIVENIYAIMIISFGSAFWIAMLVPIIIGLITEYSNPHHKWVITWAQEFVARWWEIAWALVVWVLSVIIGLKTAFIIIGVGIFFVASRLLFGRIRR